MNAYSLNPSRRRSRLVSGEHGIHRVLNAQRYEYGGVQHDVRMSGMNVSRGAAMLEIGGDARALDARVERRTDRQEYLRSQARAKAMPVGTINRKGIRTSFGLTILLVVSVVMMAFVIHSGIRVQKQERALNSLRISIERSTQRNDSLRAQYQEAYSEMNIAYNAKDLGLVSSKSLSVTKLYAPTEAQISPAANVPALPRETLATILGY